MCLSDHSSRGVLPNGVCEYDGESSIIRWPWPTRGCCAVVKQKDTNAHHAEIMGGAKRVHILRGVENSEDFFFVLPIVIIQFFTD